jgi:hypothetical protein
MSVLLMGGIYEVRRFDGLEWHNIHTKFHYKLYGHLSNIKTIGPKI